ncbi:MAG: hypothetical protein AB7T74_16690 [Clostridia bacterium]
MLEQANVMDSDGLLTLDSSLTSARRRELRMVLEAAGYKGSGASRITVQTPQQEGTPARIRALFAFLAYTAAGDRICRILPVQTGSKPS